MQKYRESYISGEFDGWDSNTIYTLDDGSQWQLVGNNYSAFYCYHPKVLLWRDGEKFYLQVQHMNDKQEVQQILKAL